MPSQRRTLLAQLFCAVLAVSTNPIGSAESGRPPLYLDGVQRDSLSSSVIVRDPLRPDAVVRLHLPEYVAVHGEVRDVRRTVARHHADGSVTVTGNDGPVCFSFLLTPAEDYADIRGTVSNVGVTPFAPDACLASCIDVRRTPPFAPDAGAVSTTTTGDGSLVVLSAADDSWHAAVAWNGEGSAQSRGDGACAQSTPHIGALPPGGTRALDGRIYVTHGSRDSLTQRVASDARNRERVELDVPEFERRFSLTVSTNGDVATVSVSARGPAADHTVRLYRKTVPYLPYTGPESTRPVGKDASHVIDESRFGGDSVVVFTDAGVEIDDVLGYWVQVDGLESSVVTVRVRDPRLMWSPARVDDTIERMFRRFAGRVRVKTHGTTADGWPLRSVSAGNPDRMVTLVGGIHPGEAGPEFLLPVFEQLVADNRELLEHAGIAVLPLVNGDTRGQLTAGHPTYLRTNARGVDLNRNFDADWSRVDVAYGLNTAMPAAATYRGPYPESEPETRATIDFVETFRPVLLVSMHGPGSVFFSPRLSGTIDMSGELQDSALRLLEAYADGDSIPSASELESRNPGTLPRWAAMTRGVLAHEQENDASRESLAFNHHALTARTLHTFQKRNYRMWRHVLEQLGQ